MFQYLKKQDYNIGFTSTPIEDVLSGKTIEYKWLKHPYKDRWFADPFILDVTNNEIHILVEVVHDNNPTGYIAHLIVDKATTTLKSMKPVLVLSTHLSYPIIIRKDGKIFVHPENSASGKLNMYRYDLVKDEFLLDHEMVSEPLKDATTLEYNGRTFMFSTQPPYSNGKQLDVWEKTDGRFVRSDNVQIENCTARMAGDFFVVDGQLYRPAQDNNISYGGAMYLQKVEYIDGKWTFKNIRHLTSEHPTHKTGMHTWNTYKGLTVVDIHGYRHYRLVNLLMRLRNLLKK